MSFGWIDAVVLIVFFLFGFTGYLSGLLRSGVQAIAFVAGVVFAGLFYQRLANDLSTVITNSDVDAAVSLIVIFVASVAAGQLIAVAFRQAYGFLFFGPLDGVGGLILGLLKAFILIELVAVILARYHVGTLSDLVQHSFFIPHILKAVPLITRLLPSDFRQSVQQFVQSSS